MDVLDVGAQCVHCKVYIRCIHAHVLMTIVYGENDVVGRRRLWADLARISHTVWDTPWLVGGDFNTCLDLSEVCGHSGDIRARLRSFRNAYETWALSPYLCRVSGFHGIIVAVVLAAFGRGWIGFW
ncbi:UNVERIFIED_CONTAM: hypothetical protein Slati_1675400 [Sesamum latifolium]|uniref:Endonuclease/exonuclease/phosphatase domain-containing protein n=1 Tax=Sesamum latifolium TaxID=2727402 RepID=A0AAW2WVI5_9LAMI